MPATVYLITGGARSGKSSYAQSLCEKLSSNPIYLATSASEGEYVDESFRDRIRRHQAARDERWTTVEETMELSKHLKKWEGRVVLVDCLSLWLTNYMLACNVFSVDGKESIPKNEQIEAAEKALSAVKEEFDKLSNQWNTTFVFVTNEVGSGTHASEGIARLFVDYQGFFNQYVASKAFRVVHMVSGCATVVKQDDGKHRRTCSLEPTTESDIDDAFILDKYLSSRSIEMDDKGYMIFKIADKRIIASFYSCILNDKGEVCDLNRVKIKCCDGKNTREPMKEWSARTAKELCAMMLEEWEDAEKIFSIGHAAYIGREAMKAEKALYANGFYQQD
jgi:adenosylcobinamide kinase/adenosylcobinamide-phosphate guanylyltransferase